MQVKEQPILDKRQAILNATLRLISQKGFVGTSTALIAKEAGVGMGTIYRYFDSKEQLLEELFKERSQKLQTVILESILSESESIYDQFENIIRGLFYYYSVNPLESQFLEKYSDSPFHNKETLDETSLLLEPIAMILSGMEDSITLKELPVEILFALIYGPLIAIIHLVHQKKVELSEDIISQTSKACWDAIAK